MEDKEARNIFPHSRLKFYFLNSKYIVLIYQVKNIQLHFKYIKRTSGGHLIFSSSLLLLKFHGLFPFPAPFFPSHSQPTYCYSPLHLLLFLLPSFWQHLLGKTLGNGYVASTWGRPKCMLVGNLQKLARSIALSSVSLSSKCFLFHFSWQLPLLSSVLPTYPPSSPFIPPLQLYLFIFLIYPTFLPSGETKVTYITLLSSSFS